MKALRAIEKHGRGIVQIATGGGKSKISKLIAARFNRPTIFITTRGSLMYQMKEGFEDAGMKVGVIGDGEWRPTKGVNVAMVQTLVSHLQDTSLNEQIRLIKERIQNAEFKELKVLRSSLVRKKTKPQDIDLAISKQMAKQDALRKKPAQIKIEAQQKVDFIKKRRARLIRFLETIEIVIGEEAHEAGGNSYYEIMKFCRQASVRVALTATPFMRESIEDNMRLMAAFGPILIKVSEKTLIDRGILAKPIFKFVDVEPNPKLRKSSPWERAYKLEIMEGAARNKAIVEYAVKGVQHKMPVIILIQRKDHGTLLLEMLEAAKVNVRFIQGENDQASRNSALKALGNGNIEVLIGTTIMDVGIDVPAVSMVILAGGGKAEVGTRQRIGRGLRGKKDMPNFAFIIDFVDKLNPHLREHANSRRYIIEQTPGFAEGVLMPDEDFPWGLFAKS
jgi:superfamily II DNA or RNA helicase